VPSTSGSLWAVYVVHAMSFDHRAHGTTILLLQLLVNAGPRVVSIFRH
jgi:hypothetical protein